MYYLNIENLEYFKNNFTDFKNKDGTIATFEEVFMSKREWWSEVGTDMLIEVVEMFCAETGSGLERIIPVEKYEKWKNHFPSHNIEEKAIQEKELQELELLRAVPLMNLKTEETHRLNTLEKKIKE